MSDLISRQAAIDAVNIGNLHPGIISALKSIIEEIPSAESLTEDDYTELRGRFSEYVEFVVRDMITRKGERWK